MTKHIIVVVFNEKLYNTKCIVVTDVVVILHFYSKV